MKPLQEQLQLRRQQHLYRSREVLDSPQGVEVVVDGRPCLSFCSNDYLGLANHPGVVAAFRKGLEQYGAGSGAAHLVSGHSRVHHELEEALAAFVERPRALLFSTGYMANLGVLGALLGRSDCVLEDRLNHASLLDAAQLSGARLRRYRHADVDDLAARFAAHTRGDCLVATDGVFSMDGDSAPLSGIAALCRQHGAWCLVDDAHGLGVLGRNGRGSVHAAGLDHTQVPVLMGTLGKAFGTFGAFVAGSEELIETLIQQARTYIYTTATPPALASATLAALRLVETGDERRAGLLDRIRQFRAGAAQLGLPLLDSATAIQPLVAGDAARALALSAGLRAAGLLVTAIRPPTVPAGSARLRITFSAQHTGAHVDRLLDVLEQVWQPGNEPQERVSCATNIRK